MIAGKQLEWKWPHIDFAVRHYTAGAGIWPWASNDGGDPDVAMARAGTGRHMNFRRSNPLAHVRLSHRIRVVNVVD